MVRVVGIDPGTRSFDICGLEDLKIFYEGSIPSEEVAKDPGSLKRILENLGKLDVIVGPSGYGIPIKHIKEINEDDLFQMVLVREDEKIPVLVGLVEAVKILKETDLNIYFIPGVIHLPTVPVHRKINCIDMGTADKLCCAFLAIYDFTKRHGISYDECDIILVEIGFGYNAAIAVKSGKIVDGIGGTRAGIGFLTSGAWDGEVAYLAGCISKSDLFKGGVRSIVGDDDMEPEEFPKRAIQDRMTSIAWEAFMEGIEKVVLSLLASVKEPRAIILSGRLSRVEEIRSEIKRRLSYIAPVEVLKGFGGSSKEAAQGAALIADGIAGGSMFSLLKHMEIDRASGSLFDHIYVAKIKERYIRSKP